jgi:small subunit ribosomal protein S17
MPSQTRNKRNTITGTVTSRSGLKSVKVTYAYKISHPRYVKQINRRTVIHVHDEKNECSLGDQVEIMATRPISKLKRWRISRIISKSSV